MPIVDRRSGRDRRNEERHSVNIEIEWEGLLGRKPGILSDISISGGFILSSGEVEDGEKIKVLLPLSDGMKVQFLGEVVNHVFEIGFALKFVELAPPQKEYLEKLIAVTRKP